MPSSWHRDGRLGNLVGREAQRVPFLRVPCELSLRALLSETVENRQEVKSLSCVPVNLWVGAGGDVRGHGDAGMRERGLSFGGAGAGEW